MDREVLLDVKDLDVVFGERKKRYEAVKHVNFRIYKGETFGLVGESGSGKTTIGRAIMRIVPSSGGDVIYKGQKINGKISPELDRQVMKEIQMIFQDPQASLNERAKVDYIISEGLMNIEKGLDAGERKRRVDQALTYLGVQYRWGGRSTAGIDCSGLTSACYMLCGILTYRDAKIVEGFPVHEIPKEEMKQGDLLYFPGHIAMVLGDGKYIHSTGKVGSGGVVINSLNPVDVDYRQDLADSLYAVGSIF